MLLLHRRVNNRIKSMCKYSTMARVNLTGYAAGATASKSHRRHRRVEVEKMNPSFSRRPKMRRRRDSECKTFLRVEEAEKRTEVHTRGATCRESVRALFTSLLYTRDDPGEGPFEREREVEPRGSRTFFLLRRGVSIRSRRRGIWKFCCAVIRG